MYLNPTSFTSIRFNQRIDVISIFKKAVDEESTKLYGDGKDLAGSHIQICLCSNKPTVFCRWVVWCFPTIALPTHSYQRHNRRCHFFFYGVFCGVFCEIFRGVFCGVFIGSFIRKFIGIFLGIFLGTFLGTFLRTFLGISSWSFYPGSSSRPTTFDFLPRTWSARQTGVSPTNPYYYIITHYELTLTESKTKRRSHTEVSGTYQPTNYWGYCFTNT